MRSLDFAGAGEPSAAKRAGRVREPSAWRRRAGFRYPRRSLRHSLTLAVNRLSVLFAPVFFHKSQSPTARWQHSSLDQDCPLTESSSLYSLEKSLMYIFGVCASYGTSRLVILLLLLFIVRFLGWKTALSFAVSLAPALRGNVCIRNKGRGTVRDRSTLLSASATFLKARPPLLHSLLREAASREVIFLLRFLYPV